MDSASNATVPPSSSSAANPRGAGRPRPDELMSSFTGLNLRSATAHGSIPARASGVRPAFGLPGRSTAGDGEGGASAGPRLAAGRGRARTLPAWMTAGGDNATAAVPDGLQEQSSAGDGAVAGASQAIAGSHTSGPQFGSGAMAGGVSQAAASGFYSSRLHVSTHTDQLPGTNGQGGGQQTKKKDYKNKAKDKSRYDSKHYASATSSYYGRGNDGRGAGQEMMPSMGGQSSSKHQFATTRTTNWENPPPAPSSGMSFIAPPKPAASLSNDRLRAAGRGVERTHPAWMTGGVTATPGGLQQQAPSGKGPSPAARKSRPTGLYSSRAPSRAQSAPQASQDSSFYMSTDSSSASANGQQDQPNQGGRFHMGRAALSGEMVWKDLFRKKGISSTRHTFGLPKTSTTAGDHVPGAGIPARALFSGATAASLSGSQHRAPAHNGFGWMPRAGDLFASGTQQTSPFGSRADMQARAPKDGNERKRGLTIETNANQSETSGTGGTPRSSGHHDGAMVVDGQNAAPAPTAASVSAPNNQAASATGFTFQHVVAPGPEPWQLSGQLLGPKRDRDEEQTVQRARSAPAVFGSTPGQQGASLFGTTGLVGKTETEGPGPCIKKKRATVVEKSSSPSKDRVATRARFKIVHHHAIPNQQQKGVGERTSSASTVPGHQHGTTKSTKLSAYGPGRASLPSTPSSGGVHEEPASPPFVVIDGDNAGFRHREAVGGGGGWSPRGPLLAIQFFEQRGVPCVAFVSGDRVSGVTFQDACYTEFQKARANGTISEVPPKAKANHFILKHAIHRKAHLVTNERPNPIGKHLAALGQTKEELKAYLSRHRVGYTFARDEFVPDPRAPLIKMLTHQASAARHGQVVIAQH